MKRETFINIMDYLKTFQNMGTYFYWNIDSRNTLELCFESSRRNNFDKEFQYEIGKSLNSKTFIEFLDRVQAEMQEHLGNNTWIKGEKI